MTPFFLKGNKESCGLVFNEENVFLEVFIIDKIKEN